MGETPEQPSNSSKIALPRDSSDSPPSPQRKGGASPPSPPRPAKEPPPGTRHVPHTATAVRPHRPEDLERLLDISTNLNATMDLEDLLTRVLQSAKEMMEAEDASIMLVDSVTERLHFAAIDSKYRQALQDVSLALGEGIAGWVALQGEVVIAADAYADPRFSTKGDAASGHRTANMICLPLKTADRIIGTLQVVNRLRGAYTPDDVPLCLSLANMAAIAIENVTLHQATERALERIQQLQNARTEFLNLVSHELRTPLTIIQGGLDIMRSGMQLDAETKQDFVRSMSANAARLKRLVDDIFITNDIDALQDSLIWRDVDVVHLARLFQTFFDQESKAPELILDLPPDAEPDVYVVRGDREKLIHCISHLLDNARKFSPPESAVTLRVRRDEPSRAIKVSVKDQGIGIASEAQMRVFDRFYQVDSSLTRQYGGTGIGLYICRKIVEAHGGMIWCHSKPEGGSDFSFAIPY